MNKEQSQIKLGDRVKDTVTGFVGIVTCISDWLNGCRRLTIQPEETRDGRPLDAFTFDAEQIKLVKVGAVPGPESEHGGPSIPPVQRKDPPRL